MYLCQPRTQHHARILNTGPAGSVTTTNKYLQILTYEDGCHFCELQSTLRHALSCSMYPQARCVYVPTRDPTSRADFQLWTHVTTTNKYLQILTYKNGCHSCELQNTLRQILSCLKYPQGRCVHVPTRDPTSCSDFEHWITYGPV